MGEVAQIVIIAVLVYAIGFLNGQRFATASYKSYVIQKNKEFLKRQSHPWAHLLIDRFTVMITNETGEDPNE